MGYLGQKYEKGLVIQRSEEGSAFQEDVEVTVEGEQELTPKVGGGFKKVTVYGAGGSEVIPNPEMEGDEPDLEGIEIDGDKYKIPEGINVEANPTLVGNENSLAGLQVGDTKYAVKTYLKFPTTWTTTGTTKAFLDAVNADSNAVEGNAYLGELTCSDLPTGLNNVEAIVEIIKSAVGGSKAIHVTLTSGNVKPYRWERTYWDNGSGDSGWKSFLVDVTASDVNSTGIASGKVLKANGSGGASWEDDIEGTPVVANPTLAGTEPNLTGLQVGNNKYKVPQGGGASLGISDDLVFKTGNLKKNIIAYFSQRYPQSTIDDNTEFMLTSNVRYLADDGGTISVGQNFHYIEVDAKISSNSGTMIWDFEPLNNYTFDLTLNSAEYGSNPIVSLYAGSYSFSGELSTSDTEVSTQEAFSALDFTENYFDIDDIISLLFYESDVVGISWRSNTQYTEYLESLPIKEILDCFNVVDE